MKNTRSVRVSDEVLFEIKRRYNSFQHFVDCKIFEELEEINDIDRIFLLSKKLNLLIEAHRIRLKNAKVGRRKKSS